MAKQNFYRAINYTSSKFAQDNLIVTSVMGSICSPNFNYNRPSFNDNLMLYVNSGTFYLEQYGKKHTLKQGDGIMIALKDHHAYYTDKQDIADFSFFHFKGKMVDDLMKLLSTNKKLPLTFSKNQESFALFNKCFKVFNNMTDTFEFEMSCAILNCVIEISKNALLEIQKNDYMASQNEFSYLIINYINDHIYEKLTLDDMANAVGLSKFHFSRIFLEMFNSSPMQYVIMKKLNLASKELTNSNLSINEIAQLFAFSDQSHFSKCFKKIYGITPIQYRRCIVDNK